MTTRIESVTIVNLQGTNVYDIGKNVNGLVIARIENNTIEYPDSIQFIYAGYTADNQLVFEAINAPFDVAYQPVKERTQ